MGLKYTLELGKSSKPEAVYFPLRSKIQSWIKNHEDNQLPLKPPSLVGVVAKLMEKPPENMKYIIDRQCTIVPECEKNSIDENWFIHFTLNFRYLGSWIF